MMKKILILVEGQTEARFVKQVLNPYISKCSLFFISVIIATKRLKTGEKKKGGISSYKKIRRDLIGLLQDTSVVAVTTMIDFYGLPNDFP